MATYVSRGMSSTCSPRSSRPSRALERQGVLLELPVGDRLAAALELEALVLQERRRQLLPHGAGEQAVALERGERLLERRRQRSAEVLVGKVVDQACERLGRIERAPDPIQAC